MASSGQCAHCDSPAKTWCGRCQEGLDSNLSAYKSYYCSIECQAANFEAHKLLCRLANARKELKRGAELAQDIYYAFRQIAFDIEPTTIKVVNGKLHFFTVSIKDKPPGPNEWPLYDFPKNVVSNDEDKKALLVYNSCEDSMAFMLELLKKLLKGKRSSSAFSTSIVTDSTRQSQHRRLLLSNRATRRGQR